jgi:RES domain-containing protein
VADPSIRRLGRARRLTGYRLVYQRFADTPLEAKAEGRFNRQNEGPTTYLSLTRRIAALEVAKRWGAAGTNRAAYVVFEVSVRLRRVVDLTDPDTAAALEVSRETLTGADLAPCQALASRLRAAGIEGILTWSSADPDGKNLVIFLDRLDPASSVGPPTVLGSLEKEEKR